METTRIRYDCSNVNDRDFAMPVQETITDTPALRIAQDAQATAQPWRKNQRDSETWEIRDDLGPICVLTTENPEAYADRMVDAVNQHQGLIDALRAIRDSQETDVSAYADFCQNTAQNALEAALKLAEQ